MMVAFLISYTPLECTNHQTFTGPSTRTVLLHAHCSALRAGAEVAVADAGGAGRRLAGACEAADPGRGRSSERRVAGADTLPLLWAHAHCRHCGVRAGITAERGLQQFQLTTALSRSAEMCMCQLNGKPLLPQHAYNIILSTRN